MKNKNIGMLLLAIYLIAVGLNVYLRIGLVGELFPILAIAAGVFILIGK